ncbi:hypothetical protein SO802_026200 [Lithocarpus litseifolius]|uniref:MULE transposase domain-containing protein n=1 Tax=Lithocarpus litseifolius TaxID=425828 RepID=A0AAW2C4A0_9ROSI
MNLCKGLTFTNKVEVKRALTILALKENKHFVINRSTKVKLYAKCVDESCKCLCIDGFKYCKPVISIDGTHLYGKYQGKLLVAMATDANNKVFPLAFAVVDCESGLSWGWFLQYLRDTIGDVIPDEVKFDNIMEPIKQVEIKAIRKKKKVMGKNGRENDYLPYTYLMSESIDMWTQSHDNGRRFEAMTINILECFNGVLKGAQGLPIAAMVEFTWSKLVAYFHDRHKEITYDL